MRRVTGGYCVFNDSYIYDLGWWPSEEINCFKGFRCSI